MEHVNLQLVYMILHRIGSVNSCCGMSESFKERTLILAG
jgi:hypothetical protein